MKHLNRILGWGGLVAVLGLICALSTGSALAGDTKTFKETFAESVVTALNPGALPQPLFEEARALHGSEVWSGVVHLFTQSNVGGNGNSVAFENVHAYPAGPKGLILYVMVYETTASGDKLVMAGTAIPQADGSYLTDIQFLPDQCTGRFAGATGGVNSLRPFPGGAVMEGTITTVGATKP